MTAVGEQLARRDDGVRGARSAGPPPRRSSRSAGRPPCGSSNRRRTYSWASGSRKPRVIRSTEPSPVTCPASMPSRSARSASEEIRSSPGVEPQDVATVAEVVVSHPASRGARQRTSPLLGGQGDPVATSRGSASPTPPPVGSGPSGDALLPPREPGGRPRQGARLPRRGDRARWWRPGSASRRYGGALRGGRRSPTSNTLGADDLDVLRRRRRRRHAAHRAWTRATRRLPWPVGVIPVGTANLVARELAHLLPRRARRDRARLPRAPTPWTVDLLAMCRAGRPPERALAVGQHRRRRPRSCTRWRRCAGGPADVGGYDKWVAPGLGVVRDFTPLAAGGAGRRRAARGTCAAVVIQNAHNYGGLFTLSPDGAPRLRAGRGRDCSTRRPRRDLRAPGAARRRSVRIHRDRQVRILRGAQRQAACAGSGPRAGGRRSGGHDRPRRARCAPPRCGLLRATRASSGARAGAAPRRGGASSRSRPSPARRQLVRPSESARSGSSWTSRKRPSTPTASAARARMGACRAVAARARAEGAGRCTLCVASKMTGCPSARMTRQPAEVDDEVAVPEGRAALGEQHVGRSPRS